MEENATGKATVCKCPYCDAEIALISETPTFCQPCSITIVTCESCGGTARQGAKECPECGEPLR
jgi:hypothetical protein